MSSLANPAFNWATYAFLAGAFGPMIGFLCAIKVDEHQRKQCEQPPQEEKLLRPAGYSLSLRLDTIQERLVNNLVASAFLSALAGFSGALFARLLGLGAPALWSYVSGVGWVVLSAACVILALKAVQGIREARNVRLGLRGEQAVAETLNQSAEWGFRAFHDLPAGKNWNIDHVAVGRKGIFVIETKARRRRKLSKGKPNHEVLYDGKFLIFPTSKDGASVEQARRNADWLREFFNKTSSENVQVEPILVLPGWFVKEKEYSFEVRVMNCRYMLKYLRNKPDRLSEAQVSKIVQTLDAMCRTIEF